MVTRREKDIWNEALTAAIEQLMARGFVDPKIIEAVDCVKIKKTEFRKKP